MGEVVWVTLYATLDAWLVQQVVDALRANGIESVFLEQDGQHVVRVKVDDVARASPLLAEFLPQGGVRASAPRSVPAVEALPAPAPAAVLPAPAPSAPVASEPAPPAVMPPPVPAPAAVSATELTAGRVLFVLCLVTASSLLSSKELASGSYGGLPLWLLAGGFALHRHALPGVNRAAVWSLLLLQALWCGMLFVPVLRSEPGLAVVSFMVISALVLGSLGVLLLAVLGLWRGYAGANPQRTGRGLAWVTVCIWGLMAAGFSFGVMRALAPRLRPWPRSSPRSRSTTASVPRAARGASSTPRSSTRTPRWA